MESTSKGPIVTVAIDTEEDNWGIYTVAGATTANIGHLPELQELFSRHGAKPSYLVNRPPLLDAASVAVLGGLAERSDVEIGAHCHPWNTPPYTGEGETASMMSRLPLESNQGKVREMTRRIESELGVRPTTWRSGRWAFGPTVAKALHVEGYLTDCSVTPFVDWSPAGGPDFSDAPHRPYRFSPEDPFHPQPDGPLTELPTTVGFLRGDQRTRAAVRRRLHRSVLRHLKLIGILDRAGVLTQRWLSPEASTAEEMIRLVDALVEAEEPVLALTFHSCTLLPGATPYVRSEEDRKEFLTRIDRALGHCCSLGCSFHTLRETAQLTT